MKRLPTLPEDVRRRLAQHCVELYEAAEARERRDRILTMHAGLLARRVDLLETDGFEAAVLATMHYGDSATHEKKAILETTLASEEFPRMVERLRTFYPEYRKRLAKNVLAGLYRHAEDPERRERILWMHTALAGRPILVETGKALALVREIVEHIAPTKGAEILESDSLSGVTKGLAQLPRDVRRRLAHHCVELYEAAKTQEQREPVVWMRAALTSGPLRYFGADELEPMLRVAVERGDVAAACEMVLSDKEFSNIATDLLRPTKDIRRLLLDKCAELYESATSEGLRDRITRMHALLSLSLGEPDDRLAVARQEALSPPPEKVFWTLAAVEMAWVELTSGRDIPLELGAEFRRRHFDGYRGKELRTVVRLLADRHPVLNAGEPWSDRALAELADLPAVWTELVAHAVTATKSGPTRLGSRRGARCSPKSLRTTPGVGPPCRSSPTPARWRCARSKARRLWRRWPARHPGDLQVDPQTP